MKAVKLCSIVAMANNHVIGKDNDLPWHIPQDLKHFKKTTMGKPIIMGRKCYESIGRPLPGRPNLVISRSWTDTVTENLYTYKTINDAIDSAKKMAQDAGHDEAFITGGGEIYRQTMDQIDRLYLTLVEKDYDGDTYFPDFDRNAWTVIEEEHHTEPEAFSFLTLERE